MGVIIDELIFRTNQMLETVKTEKEKADKNIVPSKNIYETIGLSSTKASIDVKVQWTTLKKFKK